MKKFDTKVQHLKYKVLREVAREAWSDTLSETLFDIPKKIVPGKVPTMRCCVYKERAILTDRVKLAMGGNKNNPNVIEVIDIACDECPMGGYEVTSACRGCLAHRCEDVCKFGAITFDNNHVAHIDKSKCKECGACSKVCPYSAIHNFKRPCERACKVNAIKMGEEKGAFIDNSKCISCGACVYQCPFGAISDKSFILNTIDAIKKSENNQKFKVYAMVAPAITSQFNYAKPGQVIAGLKKLGFYDVIETAVGADIVAEAETKELMEKGFLTSSCCPAFVNYIEKEFPNLTQYISHNDSPMITLAKLIKEKDSTSKIVFVGPCIAKKTEIQRKEFKGYVDSVITFEELQALFDSKNIDITLLEEEHLNDASYYGRIFARSGGLVEAVFQAVKELGLDESVFNPCVCDGIEQCKIALFKKSKNLLDANFIEGMACEGGCIGGAGCLTHGIRNKAEVDKNSKDTTEKTITQSILTLKDRKF
ncbi:MAG: 4Fe-4S dicluster domain-containing protein [Clostridia bacterium]|nr:4Fe-4S dicluster domain-containing protein [Clostridia bacterium]